ncbi:phosphonate C-P lyase system protein PhnH [Microbacterium murale]|uniref:Carbon-phosphorus lyase subunit PhnH n=1 Tax=Microbacterium murale TaxID=1081040 RepID=A0ABQ1S2N5_9MICO|nr:phosphonate C-P lyase system protein PhnH [Microbacterium murale]GGD87544.1 carbon-phosphorus lyase subunit PhnH [Microbacterium murale]
MTTRIEARTTALMSAGERHLPGFADPVQDAQHVFRAVLGAFARPTLPQSLEPGMTDRVAPLSPGVGAVLLALCDEQTPIWLDPALSASDDVCAWLRFHTGVRLVDAPGDALFVVASSPSTVPRLGDLASGTDEEPHRSATVVIDATGARGTGDFVATGPGVNGSVSWDGAGLPSGFLVQWQENHARFPRGVDLILVADESVRALPRSIRLQGAENRSA